MHVGAPPQGVMVSLKRCSVIRLWDELFLVAMHPSAVRASHAGDSMARWAIQKGLHVVIVLADDIGCAVRVAWAFLAAHLLDTVLICTQLECRRSSRTTSFSLW